ncbi:hypothetical protein KAJ27_15320, partial [bacterium]|nr:hypothetical protein [bacterium]
RGFTFLQILIAVVLMSIALIPIGKVFMASSRNIHHSSAILEANIFAATVIDNIRNNRFIKKNVNKRVYIPHKQINKIKEFLDEEDKKPDYTDRDGSFAAITSFEVKNRQKNEVLFLIDDIPDHFKKRYQGMAYFIIKKDLDTLLEDVYILKVKVIWFEHGKVKTKVIETIKTIASQHKLGN